MGPHQGHVASRGVQLGTVLVTCTSKTFRLCAACIDTDRTLIYTWKCFAVFSCLRRASLPSVDSAAILLLSSPVAEQYLTVEDGPLSPPGFRQQSSVAEHFLAVEDGFVTERQSVDAGPLSPLSIRQQSCR